MKVLFLGLVQSAATPPVPGKLWWLYIAGAVVLVIGLAKISRGEIQQARGTDRVLVLGRLFFALPLAVFGAEHLILPRSIAPGVPSWIPWHMFWVLLVGVAHISASLSITVKKFSVLAATLLSGMLFSFVLLIQLPNWAANPGNRFYFAILLRDLSFSAGALACAAAQAEKWKQSTRSRIGVLTRCVFAVVAAAYGVEHFLHPDFVPVVPLNQLLPSWIPAHLVISYVTGAALLVSGVSLALNWKGRLAATWLGIVILAVVLLVYLPMAVIKVPDVRSLNFITDTLMFCGAVLLLADLLPSEENAEAPAVNRAEPIRLLGVSDGEDVT